MQRILKEMIIRSSRCLCLPTASLPLAHWDTLKSVSLLLFIGYHYQRLHFVVLGSVCAKFQGGKVMRIGGKNILS